MGVSETKPRPFYDVASPQSGLVLKDGKVVLGESVGTKTENLFHNSCYYNEMENVCARKI